MMQKSVLAVLAASLVLAACQSSGGGAGGAGVTNQESHEDAIRRIEREGAEMRRRSGTP